MEKVLWTLAVLAFITGLPAYSQDKQSALPDRPAKIRRENDGQQRLIDTLRQEIVKLQKRNAELVARIASLEEELQMIKIDQAAKDRVNIDFCYPVVMVNGQRANQRYDRWHRRISLALSPNSQQDVNFGIIVAGREQKISGKIEVFGYPGHIKREAVVIAPLNADEFYQNIIRNGCGELTITECVYDPANKRGVGDPPLVKIHFGSRGK